MATLSEVALLKRLRRTRSWLVHLVTAQLGVTLPPRAAGTAPVRIRIVDATTVTGPGSRGTDWRLHVGFDLGRLTLDHVEVTDAHGGESLTRFSAAAGEVVVADRGYAHRAALAAVAATGAAVVVRLNWQNVPLQCPHGCAFDLLAALGTLATGQVREWRVQTAPTRHTPAVAGRLIAFAKSPEAAEEARRRLRQLARKRGKTPDARTLQAAAYVFVFTTLTSEQAEAPQVLELYRFRWQIELAFKRLKSLIELDELPAKGSELAQAVLLTKVLVALLVDHLRHQWAPWAGSPDPLRPASLWRVYRAVIETLRQMIGPALRPEDWLRVEPHTRGLRDTPRKRMLQRWHAQSFRLGEPAPTVQS